MSGERPDFQQPTGITSQQGGVASAEEFAAQSDDVGVNVDIRTLGAGNDVLRTLNPGGTTTPVVIQRVFLLAQNVAPSDVSFELFTGVTTFTGEAAEFFTDGSQMPVSFSPGIFLPSNSGYSFRITNNAGSAADVSTAVVVRRVQ